MKSPLPGNDESNISFSDESGVRIIIKENGELWLGDELIGTSKKARDVLKGCLMYYWEIVTDD